MELLLVVGGWIIGGVTAFLGARWGALAADRLSQQRREEEAKQKRETLVRVLHRQLEYVKLPPPPYQAGTNVTPATFNLTAIPQLLDGTALEYARHGAMLQALLDLQ